MRFSYPRTGDVPTDRALDLIVSQANILAGIVENMLALAAGPTGATGGVGPVGATGAPGTAGAGGAQGLTGPASTTVVLGGGLVSGRVFAVDVCATFRRSGVFTFDLPASIGASRVGKPVLIQQAAGKDEADPILLMAAKVVSPTKVRVVWQSSAPFRGRAAVHYLIGA